MNPLETLRHHVTGAVDRKEKQAIAGIISRKPAPLFSSNYLHTTKTKKGKKMKLMGTIFASESQLAAFDAFSDQQRQARESRSKTSDLADFSRRIVNGETRWYDGENRFAVITASGKRLWFSKWWGDWFAE